MRTTTALLAAAAILAGGLVAADTATAGAPSPAGPRPAIARGLYRTIDARGSASVIVMLRGNPATAHPDTRRGTATHAAAVRGAQAPVLSLLARSGAARQVHAYKAFSMVSARVTKSGLKALAASPDVARVVPNGTVRSGVTPVAAGRRAAAGASRTVPPGTCSTDRTKPQLAPQALETTRTQSDTPSAPTARSLGATGAGVKVAFFAEGIDVNNPDFIRPDGSKVFTDYQDFSGDGTAAPTAAGEAFIDASSVAAQGNETYNVQDQSAVPTSTPCYIRVEGVAPGASLVDLNVFGDNELSLTSTILQAIDWAVDHDHVDVLSQSFGYNPYPDTANDVIRQADEAAVAAGAVVTVSSGDSGITNTIGSPASAPGVISVAATTTLRYYLQAGYGGAQFPGITGELDDNISSLSSGGETERGSTVDMSAPGDLNWALCTPDLAQYEDCASFTGEPTPVSRAGGTSESAPLVAGGAALVIQAYRQTHGGATPSPYLVKQILVSSARDVLAPADQQGAGELDSYRAVLLARSIHTADGAGSPQGASAITSPGQIDVRGAPGAAVRRTITVRNTSATLQTINVGARTLGPWSAFHQQTATLSKSSPTSTDWQGYADPYRKLTFRVPAGADRLDASIAYHRASDSLNARGRLSLVDPHGRLAMYSLPQGVGNYGDVQVARPAAGIWTAYVYSRPTSGGGSEGRYVFGWRTASYVAGGAVTPDLLALAPGRSGTFTYTANLPATPGDRAVSFVVSSPQIGTSTVPIVLRSQIPLSAAGTPFRQTLTGGNGRGDSMGQAFYYQVQVPAGTPELNALVTLAHNPDNPFFLSLVDPHGDQVGSGSNVFRTAPGAAAQNGLSGTSHVLNPAAGTWDVIVNFAGTVSGDDLAQSFRVLVSSAAQPLSAHGLPDDASSTLPGGRPTVITLHVTNHSGTSEAYFVDPRLTGLTTYAPVGTDTTLTLPANVIPHWLVPSETSTVTESLQSSRPVQFDFGPDSNNGAPPGGDPDLESDSSGTTAAGTYTAPVVASGQWFQAPSEIGPYGATGAPQVQAAASMTVRTRAFDGAVTSATGDLWPTAVDPGAAQPTPIVVAAGASADIPVTITPRGRAGAVVSGTLFLDQLSSQSAYGELPNANEVASVPYTYTIGG